MIIIQAPQEEMQNAAKASKLLSFSSISPSLIVLKNNQGVCAPSGQSKNRELSVSIGLKEPTYELLDRIVTVSIGTRVDFYEKSLSKNEESSSASESAIPSSADQENLSVFEIVVELLLVYETPPPPAPDWFTSKLLPSFVKYNAIYNAWPFIREKVHYLTMGLGEPFVMPLMRLETISSTVTAPEEDSLLIDGE